MGKKRSTRNKKRQAFYKKSKHQPDWWLVLVVLLLSIFGLVMIANVSAVEAYRDFGDKYHFLKLQAQWLFLGLIGFLSASFFPYQNFKKLVPVLLFLSLLSLVLVILPRFGLRVFGARRWITIGGVTFQPAELTKLAYILYLAAYLTKKKDKPLPALLVSGLIVFLVMLQPDLGMSVVILTTGFIVYFISGAPVWHLLLLVVVGLLTGFGLVFSSAYRKERFLTFLDPFRDPLGSSYHIRQILIALGSGGLFGLGLGQSRQKYEYIPAVTTDSVFAVIAEELGYIGASFLILVYLFLIYRGFRVAQKAPDQFSQLLASGIIAWIGVQAMVNLAAMVALVPLTGMPLPFISYGGSSLLLALIGMGIVVNISFYTA